MGRSSGCERAARQSRRCRCGPATTWWAGWGRTGWRWRRPWRAWAWRWRPCWGSTRSLGGSTGSRPACLRPSTVWRRWNTAARCGCRPVAARRGIKGGAAGLAGGSAGTLPCASLGEGPRLELEVELSAESTSIIREALDDARTFFLLTHDLVVDDFTVRAFASTESLIDEWVRLRGETRAAAEQRGRDLDQRGGRGLGGVDGGPAPPFGGARVLPCGAVPERRKSRAGMATGGVGAVCGVRRVGGGGPDRPGRAARA